MIKQRTKQIFVIAMFAIILTAIFSSNIVFASGDGVFDDFDVGIDQNGNLKKPTNKDGDGSGWQGIISKYKKFIVGIAGVGAVTMVLAFIFKFIKLAHTADPKSRSEAVIGLMWTGIAAAGLGAVAIITALFYGAIK